MYELQVCWGFTPNFANYIGKFMRISKNYE